MASIGEAVAEPNRRAIKSLADVIQRDLAAHVPPARFDVRFVCVVQAVDEDLPEPGEQLALAAAAELTKVTISAEQRFLDKVRCAHAPPQACVELRGGQDGEIVAIELQQVAELRAAKRFGPREEGIGIHHVVIEISARCSSE